MKTLSKALVCLDLHIRYMLGALPSMGILDFSAIRDLRRGIRHQGHWRGHIRRVGLDVRGTDLDILDTGLNVRGTGLDILDVILHVRRSVPGISDVG